METVFDVLALALDKIVEARFGYAHFVGDVAHGGGVIPFDAE